MDFPCLSAAAERLFSTAVDITSVTVQSDFEDREKYNAIAYFRYTYRAQGTADDYV